MIVNEACVDWMTLTSYRLSDIYSGVRQAVFATGLFGEFVLMKKRGYAGVMGQCNVGTAFMGVGRVVDRQHYMAVITSDAAQYTLEQMDVVNGGQRMRRVDVQLTMFNTMDAPQTTYAYQAARDTIELSEKRNVGRKPIVRFVHGGERAMHTLYIGSRSSDKFVRVYEKESVDGNRWTRLEVELKGRLAEDLWTRIRSNKDGMQYIFRAVLAEILDTLPETKLLKAHKRELGTTTFTERVERQHIVERDPNVWVEVVLLPALSKLIDSGNANLHVLTEIEIMGHIAAKMIKSRLIDDQENSAGLLFLQPSLLEDLPFYGG